MEKITLDLADPAKLPAIPRVIGALTLGVFDALHIGHRAIVNELLARRDAGPATLVTFSCHPQQILRVTAPVRILHPHLADRILEQWGLDLLVTIETNEALLALTADEFLRRFYCALHPRVIVIGPDFRFGKDRAGDAETVRRFGVSDVVHVPQIMDGSDPVSATAIRALLAEGRVRDANRKLGRLYSVLGVEERGDGIGRKLGAPTLNLVPPPEALGDGIYVVRTQVGLGVAHLGPRPALKAPERRFEVHILDEFRPIAGQEWEVQFLDRLRDIENFPSLDALALAIAADIRNARRIGTDFMATECSSDSGSGKRRVLL